jgi:hypothetical protein
MIQRSMGNLCADRTHCQSQTRLRINLKQGPKPRADDVSSILRDATRPRQRRILSVEDHDFPEALRGRLLGVIERGIILCPLLAPRRCIAVPMVFYRCAQESASEMPRPRTLANIVRRSSTMSRLPHRLEIERRTEAQVCKVHVSFRSRAANLQR